MESSSSTESRSSSQSEQASEGSSLRTILVAFLIAFAIRIAVFEAFEIEGPSMEPTFLNGDRVIVAKYTYGLFLPFMNEAIITWGVPFPGDVVIVRSPADNLDIVKRVIGVPGDRIEIRDDIVYRNGVPLRTRQLGPCNREESSEDPAFCMWYEESINNRRYRTSTSVIEMPDFYAEREVPPNHVFVLGDHRDRSNDSRNPAVGMIPFSRIKGRALLIYWSSDKRIRWNRIFKPVE
ncbi:MAG: signal peptidase I [Deltaproteobacteria bacterium]|nr:signal peptidase I [Deltaproteobacteria bacterium]